MGEFDGKVAIVAGGSKGIGQATVRKLAPEGASIVFCGSQPGPVQATEAELRAAGRTVTGVVADVTKAADVQRLVQTAVEIYGGVDILAHSAGVPRYGTVVETDEAPWDEVMNVNVKGMFLTSKSAIPELRKRGGGVIVNVSSVQAFASQTDVAAYTASKGAINALTRAMALDHAGENIRVVAVCPASVDTPMLRYAAELWKAERTSDEMVAEWGTMHPLGRVATPDDVAEVIAFLASPRAAFVTGSEHKVDGGMLAALGVRLPES
jgi:NAD(P)-dependent dehydrogenase (short-subunit alcohol dehydrogenase family)